MKDLAIKGNLSAMSKNRILISEIVYTIASDKIQTLYLNWLENKTEANLIQFERMFIQMLCSATDKITFKSIKNNTITIEVKNYDNTAKVKIKAGLVIDIVLKELV